MTEQNDTTVIRAELEALRAEVEQLKQRPVLDASGDLVVRSLRAERLVIVDPDGHERIIADASYAPSDNAATLRVQDPSGLHHVALVSVHDDDPGAYWSSVSLVADGNEDGSFSVDEGPVAGQRRASLHVGDSLHGEPHVICSTWSVPTEATDRRKRKPLGRRAPHAGLESPALDVPGRLEQAGRQLLGDAVELMTATAELVDRFNQHQVVVNFARPTVDGPEDDRLSDRWLAESHVADLHTCLGVIDDLVLSTAGGDAVDPDRVARTRTELGASLRSDEVGAS